MSSTEEARELALFDGIQGRNTADYLMRTAQQHHVQLSQMADVKANIIITTASIVLTLSLSRLGDPEIGPALLTLSVFALASLLLAILAVLPKFRSVGGADGTLPAHFNVMFFGHFTELPRERYYAELARALKSDAAVYRALSNDLYSLGLYLARHKYPYLRWSYLFFLSGFLAACAQQGFKLLLA